MSKQRDDTPEEIDPSGEEETPGPAPGSYYYDDSTGYEVYDPEQEEEDYEDAETRGHGDAGREEYAAETCLSLSPRLRVPTLRVSSSSGTFFASFL